MEIIAISLGALVGSIVFIKINNYRKNSRRTRIINKNKLLGKLTCDRCCSGLVRDEVIEKEYYPHQNKVIWKCPVCATDNIS